jgi:hypothetical protein
MRPLPPCPRPRGGRAWGAWRAPALARELPGQCDRDPGLGGCARSQAQSVIGTTGPNKLAERRRRGLPMGVQEMIPPLRRRVAQASSRTRPRAIPRTRLQVQRLGAIDGLQELLRHPRLAAWRAPKPIGWLFQLTAGVATGLPVYRTRVPGPAFSAVDELMASSSARGRAQPAATQSNLFQHDDGRACYGAGE